jgi:hypothetical protein
MKLTGWKAHDATHPLLGTSERRQPPKILKLLVAGLVIAFIVYHRGYLLLEFLCEILGQIPLVGEISPHGRSRLASKWALIDQNFPDPCFIESAKFLYAFATRNSSAVNIQVALASANKPDIWTFDSTHDALPDPGPWTAKQLNDIAVWAPSVVEIVLSSYSSNTVTDF